MEPGLLFYDIKFSELNSYYGNTQTVKSPLLVVT